MRGRGHSPVTTKMGQQGSDEGPMCKHTAVAASLSFLISHKCILLHPLPPARAAPAPPREEYLGNVIPALLVYYTLGLLRNSSPELGGWVTWPVATGVGVTLEQVARESPFWKWLLQQDLGKRVGVFWGPEGTGWRRRRLGLGLRRRQKGNLSGQREPSRQHLTGQSRELDSVLAVAG